MSNPYKVVVSGPLAVYAEGFHAELRGVGYRPNGASGLLALMAHLSRWLDTHGAGVADLDPLLVERFLADRRAEGYVLWRSAKGLAPLLRYL